MPALYVAGLLVAVALIYLAVKFTQSASHSGFARGVAQAQLKAVLAIKGELLAAASDPSEAASLDSSEDLRQKLYTLALATRPGYAVEEVEGIVTQTRDYCKTYGGPFNLQAVVQSLVIHEFHRRTGEEYLSGENSAKMLEAIESVIPPYL